MISSVYFLLMLMICYSGHISWNLGLGYMVEFVWVWAFVGWMCGVLMYLSQEKMVIMLGFHEGIAETFYAVWGKTVTVMVRPVSLSLRLLINLTVGHECMYWLVMSSEELYFNIVGGLMSQFFLCFVVIYEVFVFTLQSFIFGRLLGVYLEEV